MKESQLGRFSGESDKEMHLAGILNYLREKHATLKNDYKMPSGQGAEACGLIAANVAKMFVTMGEKPMLLGINPRKVAEGGRAGGESLEPRIYEGRVSWGGHVVCVNHDIVYDPMVGEPKGLSEYKETIFTEPVESEVLVSADDIENFVNR